MEQAILVDNVSQVYKNGSKALDGLNLEVGKGEIFGFLGPNGAGKTTTIKLLLGFMSPTEGNVAINGIPSSNPQARAALGYLPEVANYYGFLKASEILAFYGRLNGMDKTSIKSRIQEVLDLVGLEDVGGKLIKQYSKGMQQRLGLAQALFHDPDVLILDEPMTGLDPIGRLQFRQLLQNQKKAGKTIFFSSHELSEVELICDRVAVLNKGKLKFCGPVEEIAGEGESNLERIFLDFIKEKEEAVS